MLSQIASFLILLIAAQSAWANPVCAKVDLVAAASDYVRSDPKDFPSSPNSPEPATTASVIRDGLADKEVTLTELGTTQPSIRWIGIEWEGPISGLLIAVDCQGHVLGGGSGGIEKITAGPSLPVLGDTILAQYTDSTGTGYLHKSITLYGIKGNKVSSLWTHELEESAFVMPDEPATDTKYQVSIDESGDRLDVSGDIKTYLPVKQPDGSFNFGDAPSKIEHKRESYCWDAESTSYKTCPQK